MPVNPNSPNCVGDELKRFKNGNLHSGKGGKIVTDPRQAKAISLSVCGKSKYSEMLQGLGYSEETADAITSIFAEIDWQKQFETGKGPGPRVAGNYEKDKSFGKPAPSIVPSKAQRKNNPKQDEPEMLSGPALEKGPGNPQSGSSKEVFGLRMLG
jgi:hypothetical protein